MACDKKAELNGSVIAEIVLAGPRCHRNHTLRPGKLVAIVPGFCMCDIREMLSLTDSAFHR